MAAASRVKAGDVLDGKYRVERVLGTGGMGMVVAARHVQLGQRVALKFMLKEAMSDPGNAERFAREARSACRLQSPHTARVSDVGKLKNGEPYMVMEYLDGLDLDEVLRRNGAMPPALAAGYILQACEAFAEAHGLGMIHRDIKPKNLFLSQTVSGTPIVKVLDFGLAKTIGALGDVSLTATAAVFGSPQYMSPEQMRSAKDVDARSDIWSIGVCLYELLTTRVPFDAPGLAEICAMVLKDPVEPPSKWARGLPPELDAVVVKCLEKDPAKRYQTVAELAFALEPWAEPGSARRIVQVMETARKVDLPTMMNIDAPGNMTPEHDAAPKTMDAWDSGERGLTRRIPTWLLWSGGSAAALGVIGAFLIILTMSVKKPALPAAATSASEPVTSAPVSVPDPVLAPVAAPAETAAPAAAPIVPEPVVTSDPTPPTPPTPPVVTKPVAPVITSPPVKPALHPTVAATPRPTPGSKPTGPASAHTKPIPPQDRF